eukprot:TRINITY_DN96426_c0_g1_i1.p1 TRINITY_DN96426_c0_g1~~TRINITY_DN96426_c0_g1_i1.p1  ORF type:complete len:350 (+),score=57.04 TRINITY_DN96426_c0_g1_i1:21-1070(+)
MEQNVSFATRRLLAGALAWISQLLPLGHCHKSVFQNGDADEKPLLESDAPYGSEDRLEIRALLQDLQALGETAGIQACINDLSEPDPFSDFMLQVVPGVPLSAMLSKQGSLSEETARPILVGLLRALHTCHCRRVCHQNVRPESIVLMDTCGAKPTVVLTDFSAACPVSLSGDPREEFFDEYVAPEVLQGHRLLGDMLDMWGSGLCFHEMLAGSLPWRKGHDLYHEITGEAEVNSLDASPEAKVLLEGMLQRDVLRRSLVLEALRHDWCRLPETEIMALFVNDRKPSCDASENADSVRNARKPSLQLPDHPSERRGDASPSITTKARGSSAGPLARRGAWPKSWLSRNF